MNLSKLFIIFNFLFYNFAPVLSDKSILCLHDIDTPYGKGTTRFNLEHFDTQLCSHLVYSTMSLDIETNTFVKKSEILKEKDKNDKMVNALKNKNPRLKILMILDVDQTKFWAMKLTDVMSNVSHVDDLANNVVTVLEENTFDGIYFESILSEEETNSFFMNFIRSLKKAFSSKQFILAYACSNNKEPIIQSYDLADLSQNVDLLILETYNLHDAILEPQLADHHAPLYNRPWDMENKTVDSLVNHWIEKGFPAEKILLTIPLWGNAWTVSTKKTNPPAPAYGRSSPKRKRRDTLGYFEICDNIDQKNWQVCHYDNQTMGPYAFSPADSSHNSIWVGFDDSEMAVVKSTYIVTKGLGGAAVKDISFDYIPSELSRNCSPILPAIRKSLPLKSNVSTLNFKGYTFVVLFFVVLLFFTSFLFSLLFVSYFVLASTK